MTPEPVATSVTSAAVYDKYADQYDRAYTSALHHAEDRVIQGWLAQVIPPTARVIDLGCGTGLLLDLCPRPPERYLGVDISQAMLAVAAQKYPAHARQGGFLQADMTRTGQPEHAFDAAVCLYGGVSYTTGPGFLLELQRILRPGAPFFLMFVGQGASERPSQILEETRGLWRVFPYERLRSVFQAIFSEVQVRPFSGLMAAKFAEDTEEMTLSPYGWSVLLHAETHGMMPPGGAPEQAYWQVVTGRTRR